MATHQNRRDHHLHMKVNGVLSGKSGRYQIQRFLGSGSFGEVASCVKLETKEEMAVKIVPKDLLWAGKQEVAVLLKLRELDGEKNNLVRLTDHFKHKGHSCMVFEMLDMNLHDLMEKRSFKPLCLSGIRAITQHMLMAMNALKGIGIAHTDIKPENVMLVNHAQQPFRVKLIDFGLARQVSSMSCCTPIQALGYRAPEVILGLQLDVAVDMWSLGCLVAYMYLGRHLYPTCCPYEVMRVITRMHGQPEDHLLDSGIRSEDFFSKDKDSPSPSWRLNTQDEYRVKTGNLPKPCRAIFDKFTSLDDVTKTDPEVTGNTEYKDTQAFSSLFKQMLHVNPEKRITPSEALGHPYITIKH